MISSKILKKIQNTISYSYDEFKKDMEIHHNFQDFPEVVKGKIHTLVYSEVDSGGYVDMMYAYYDVVDLARTCLEI